MDEQVGESFVSLANPTKLEYDVTAIEQTTASGYGPAYLVNGITDAGWWYQVGLAYNWPNQDGSINSGFEMNYEAFNSNGVSVYPSNGGGGGARFTGPVNQGDTVTLQLTLGNGFATMSAHDLNTGASASKSYRAYGASFVGTRQTSDRNGFFSGLMTEEYHDSPFYGSEKPVAYFAAVAQSSAWLWADEYNTGAGCNTSSCIIFSSSTSSPVSLSEIPRSYSSHGTVQYATSQGYLTGIPNLHVIMSSSPKPYDAGQNVDMPVTAQVVGGLPPFVSSLTGSGFAPKNLGSIAGFTIQSSIVIPSAQEGTYSYSLAVSDSLGQNVQGPLSQFVVNSDPVLSVQYQHTYDAGMPLNLTRSASGGTEPYTFSVSRFNPETTGNQTLTVSFHDSAGYALTKTITVTVNPLPTVALTSSASTIDAGMPLNYSFVNRGGTGDLTNVWYLNGTETQTPVTDLVEGAYNVTISVVDAFGMRNSSSVQILVNSDPAIQVSTKTDSSFFYSNTALSMNPNVTGGTAPYSCQLFLGSQPASESTAANCANLSYDFTSMGTKTLTIRLNDSAGYSLMSEPITITYSYNYVHVGFVVALVAAVVVIAAVLLQRRNRTKKPTASPETT